MRAGCNGLSRPSQFFNPAGPVVEAGLNQERRGPRARQMPGTALCSTRTRAHPVREACPDQERGGSLNATTRAQENENPSLNGLARTKLCDSGVAKLLGRQEGGPSACTPRALTRERAQRAQTGHGRSYSRGVQARRASLQGGLCITPGQKIGVRPGSSASGLG